MSSPNWSRRRDRLQGEVSGEVSADVSVRELTDELRFTAGEYAVVEDQLENRVVIVVSSPVLDELTAATKSLSVAKQINVVLNLPAVVEVEFGPSGPSSSNSYCSKFDCRWEMMGGIEIEHGGEPHCTSGFPMILNGVRAGSTAGHCHDVVGNSVGEWRTNGPNGHVGVVNIDVKTGACDVELFKHTTNPWVFSSWIHLGSEPRRDIDRVNPAWNYPLGVTVGMSGVETGNQTVNRGPIVATNYAPSWVTGAHSFIMADYAERSGDSGAPVSRNDEAWGMHAGHGLLNFKKRAVFMRARYMETCTGATIML